MHDGIASFTIGQRRGLGVATGERRYVVDVDAAHRDRHARRPHRSLARLASSLRDLTYVDASPAGRVDLFAQTARARRAVAATFDGTTVHFATPQPRVAPGQVVALYDGDALLGGGIAT